ncbi:MAG TPA: Hpt domain-containing protein [Pyrinomonadaceae bacterium]|nr:Hpt domain-containing protein [Pyrinomonadaceae bacterium]
MSMFSDSSHHETVDLDVLRNLADAQGEDESDLVVELIDLYLTDTQRRLVSFCQARDDRDALALARAAHALKGSSATLGACFLARLCEELERLARLEAFAELVEVMRRLEEECVLVKEKLLRERQLRVTAGGGEARIAEDESSTSA